MSGGNSPDLEITNGEIISLLGTESIPQYTYVDKVWQTSTVSQITQFGTTSNGMQALEWTNNTDRWLYRYASNGDNGFVLIYKKDNKLYSSNTLLPSSTYDDFNVLDYLGNDTWVIEDSITTNSYTYINSIHFDISTNTLSYNGDSNNVTIKSNDIKYQIILNKGIIISYGSLTTSDNTSAANTYFIPVSGNYLSNSSISNNYSFSNKYNVTYTVNSVAVLDNNCTIFIVWDTNADILGAGSSTVYICTSYVDIDNNTITFSDLNKSSLSAVDDDATVLIYPTTEGGFFLLDKDNYYIYFGQVNTDNSYSILSNSSVNTEFTKTTPVVIDKYTLVHYYHTSYSYNYIMGHDISTNTLNHYQLPYTYCNSGVVQLSPSKYIALYVNSGNVTCTPYTATISGWVQGTALEFNNSTIYPNKTIYNDYFSLWIRTIYNTSNSSIKGYQVVTFQADNIYSYVFPEAAQFSTLQAVLYEKLSNKIYIIANYDDSSDSALMCICLNLTTGNVDLNGEVVCSESASYSDNWTAVDILYATDNSIVIAGYDSHYRSSTSEIVTFKETSIMFNDEGNIISPGYRVTPPTSNIYGLTLEDITTDKPGKIAILKTN